MKKIDKKIKYLCLILGVAFLLSGVSIKVFGKTEKAAKHTETPFVIVIDAGHGGIDGGVIGGTSKICESEINLEISKKLEKLFLNAGFTVVMTRTTSGGLYGIATSGYKKRDMQKRAEIIKNADADLFISVHQNFFGDRTRRGAQAFYYGDKDKEFAFRIQRRLNEMTTANRKYETLFGDYFVLKQAKCPSCLVECGFLSNEADEKLLLSESHQQYVAETLFFGALDYLTGINAESDKKVEDGKNG